MSVVTVVLQPGDELRVTYAAKVQVTPSTRLKLEEASALYRLSIRSLRGLIASGKLPAVKAGRSWTIERGDVERLLKPTRAANDSADPEDAALVAQLAAQGVKLGGSR